MSILNDKEIRDRALLGMIVPFVESLVQEIGIESGKAKGVVSYGLGSYGYDIRVADEFKVFSNVRNTLVDPKNFEEDSFVTISGQSSVIIPPNSFVLARSYERIKVPRDIMVLCIGKSTYARCGIIINVTPLEPEWEGFITMEISNTSPLPARIYSDEGISQLIFFKADEECLISYVDRKGGGKYQNQVGIVIPKV